LTAISALVYHIPLFNISGGFQFISFSCHMPTPNFGFRGVWRERRCSRPPVVRAAGQAGRFQVA